MLTAYLLSYNLGTSIPHQQRDSYEELRDHGFDAVALSFSEGEMRYGRRAFEQHIAAAHDCGLKVFAIPSRLGGRFAGSPLMPCMWLNLHPECQMPGHPHLACIEAEPFLKWIHDFMGTLIGEHELDGIIWDEIKRSGLVSSHPATLKKFGRVPTTEEAQDGFVAFLGDLTAACVSRRPELTVTMFNSATAPEYFTSRAALIPQLQYVGYDGNCCDGSFYNEEPHQEKYLIAEAWERTVRECRAAGKKTFALIENLCVPRSDHGVFQRNLNRYLENTRPDHLAVHFYGHNNECPEEVQRLTMEALRTYRITTPPHVRKDPRPC